MPIPAPHLGNPGFRRPRMPANADGPRSFETPRAVRISEENGIAIRPSEAQAPLPEEDHRDHPAGRPDRPEDLPDHRDRPDHAGNHPDYRADRTASAFPGGSSSARP